jgi:hypothetical protein
MRRRSWLYFAAIATAVVLLVVALIVALTRQGAPDITVNFGRSIGLVNPYAFSGTISTYGEGGGYVAHSAKQRRALEELAPALWRLPLKLVGGRWVSAAAGVPPQIPGDWWVQAIEVFGDPQIVIEGSTAAPNDFSPAEAAAAVHHFQTLGFRGVHYYVLGNEPDSQGMSMAEYCGRFNAAAIAMKAVDPQAQIAGPAWGKFDPDALRSFLKCAGANVDIVDWHHYAMGKGSLLTSAEALAQTPVYGRQVAEVKHLIREVVPGRAQQIQVQIGELNWSWTTADGYHGWHGDDRFYQSVLTVWAASVLGHIAAAGGIAHQYADQNGALGLTFEKAAEAAHYHRTVSDPMPFYFGQLMFAGGQYFRHFGSTMVLSRSRQPDVEVFASAHPRNVVLINKNPSAQHDLRVKLEGVRSGTAAEWQTDPARPFAPPKHEPALQIEDGLLSVTVPPYSVTTLIIN